MSKTTLVIGGLFFAFVLFLLCSSLVVTKEHEVIFITLSRVIFARGF